MGRPRCSRAQDALPWCARLRIASSTPSPIRTPRNGQAEACEPRLRIGAGHPNEIPPPSASPPNRTAEPEPDSLSRVRGRVGEGRRMGRGHGGGWARGAHLLLIHLSGSESWRAPAASTGVGVTRETGTGPGGIRVGSRGIQVDFAEFSGAGGPRPDAQARLISAQPRPVPDPQKERGRSRNRSGPSLGRKRPRRAAALQQAMPRRTNMRFPPLCRKITQR
jgi:hypothetical protein